jgi:hypothetical protein
MFETIKLIATVSRAEFLLPNLGSLIMGLAWGFTPPVSFSVHASPRKARIAIHVDRGNLFGLCLFCSATQVKV